MRKLIAASLTALTLCLAAPLAASASAIPQAQGVSASLGGVGDSGKTFSGQEAQKDMSNCGCRRRYKRYRSSRYRYYVRYYYVVYW